jgi:hypothetical protein
MLLNDFPLGASSVAAASTKGALAMQTPMRITEATSVSVFIAGAPRYITDEQYSRLP